MKARMRMAAVGLWVLGCVGSAAAQYGSVSGGSFGGAPPGQPSTARPSDPLVPRGEAMVRPEAQRVGEWNTATPAERFGEMPGPSSWLMVVPYAWTPAIDGRIGHGFQTVRVDQTLDEAWDDAQSNTRGAAALYLEAGIGRVGLIGELLHLRAVPRDDFIRVDSHATLAELLGFYRIVDTGPGPGSCTLDVLAGIRHYDFSNEFALQPFGFTFLDDSTSWQDLVLGLRGTIRVLDCLTLFARGDYGGFDLHDSSRQALNAMVGFDLHCLECLSLYGGYRYLKIDRSNGSGFDRSTIDLELCGPFLGLGLRY